MPVLKQKTPYREFFVGVASYLKENKILTWTPNFRHLVEVDIM